MKNEGWMIQAIARVWAAWLMLLLAIPSPAAAQENYVYIIKPGDTLIGFGSRYLNDPKDYVRLKDLNRLPDANLLRPGKKLLVPYGLLKFTPISAQIVAHSGEVAIRSTAQRMAPSVGLAVREGMTFETGRTGFVTLALTNGSRVSVPSLSQLRVIRLRRYLLTGGDEIDFSVDKGRAETAVSPIKDKASRFRLRTPSAVSAVRGTQFRVGFDENAKASVSEVIEGSVGVGSQATGRELAIPGGFGVAVSRTGDLNKEKLLPAPALVDPSTTQQGPDVRFTITPSPAEKAYHVQISKDAGFVDIVASERSASPTVSFAELPNGRYFVRAMAVAESGLEGLSETTSFRRQQASASAERVPGMADGFRFAWMAHGQGKTLYRFQLFDASAPNIALIDEAALEQSSLILGGLKPAVYRWRVSVKQLGSGDNELVWTPFQKLTVAE
jgi:hypothetical protein